MQEASNTQSTIVASESIIDVDLLYKKSTTPYTGAKRFNHVTIASTDTKECSHYEPIRSSRQFSNLNLSHVPDERLVETDW